MKIDNQSGKHRTWYRWTGFIAAGLLTAALSGCGGSDDTTAAAPAPGGAAPPPAAATSIATAVALAANDTATNPTASFTVVQEAGIAPVTVASPPKVNFTVASGGAVVTGLTASNVSVIIAKLVPGTNGAPDQWASYTHRTETATATVGPSGAPVLASATQATTDAKQTDAALLAAQLAYNDAGYYTYTFSTDIKDTTKTNGVVFDAGATHRVALQLSYTDAAGATVRVNPYFDFTIDASGNSVAVTDSAKTRQVVDIASCNECHSALALHGGGRVDTQYCVLCHNDGTTDANSGNNLDMRIMAHKIHNGEHANAYFGYDYAIWGYRDSKHDYGEVTYPQPLANCTKCHDGTKTPQGDNWKTKPSRAACGACHSGIDFSTGKGVTMADGHEAAEADKAVPGSGAAIRAASIGHIGGSKADDSQCTICHGAADIPVYHVTVDPIGSEGRGGYPVNTATDVPTPGYSRGQGPGIPLAAQMNLPAGVYKLDYEIKQVTVTGSAGAKKATVIYRILLDGKPLTLNATGMLKDDLDGSPGVYVAYGRTQDGIAAPADWNATASASVKALRDGTDGSQTGPDAEGFYTATLPDIIPDAATHVTAAVGVDYQAFVQLGLTAYPKGIRLREPKFVMKVADGYDARRAIVSADKCNACHAQLGVGPSFHSGARNNGEGCAFCHDANRATSHGGGWNVGTKNLVHGIHGGSKRAQDFSYEATAANPKGFGKVTYPGVLKNCEQCHVAGSYDFSGTDNKAALPNLLWTSDANDDESAASDLGLSPWLTALASGKADYSADNLVTSPIASACFGCHDSTDAVTHMQSNGGSIYARFSSVASVGAARPAEGTASTMTFTKEEQCMFCHSSDSVYGLGIKAVHAK